MEKRALIAVALSLLILVLYQEWMSRYYPAPPPQEAEPENKKVESAPPPAPKPAPVLQKPKPGSPTKTQAAREITIETDDYVALFTSQGARLKSFKLKHYRTSVDEKSPPFEMIPSVPGIPYPLGVEIPGPAPFGDEEITYSVEGGDLLLTGSSQGHLVFHGEGPAGAVLTKEFTFTGSGYAIRMQVSVERQDPPGPPAVMLTAEIGAAVPKADAPFEGLLGEVGGKLIREYGDALKGKEWSGKISWAGFGHT